ncbi:MAG: Sapep family Mn(2+)-dependent dipeptidase, partial [Candidatus Moranbacteria bacterium]|nr:Sapep family Mn(2+)-dependent dipeptidase [Candidatus Moranbacteria bacterium]
KLFDYIRKELPEIVFIGGDIYPSFKNIRNSNDDFFEDLIVFNFEILKKELKNNYPFICVILGNDDETGWRCVRHYFSVFPEAPVSGFIPDADFPLIYAEKGITRIFIEGSFDIDNVVSIEGGFRDNMVPDYAKAVLSNPIYAQAFVSFLKHKGYEGSHEVKDNQLIIKVVGKSAHGSTPQFGDNAIDRLFEFFIEQKFQGKLVSLVNDLLIHDIHGHKLGVAYHDDEMGDLTNNFGVIKSTGKTYQIMLNLRYPNGVQIDDVMTKLSSACEKYGAKVTLDKHQALLYKDPNSELISKLMAVYQKHTGDYDTKPLNIGGGTFARAMPNCVAFGPHFLDKPTYIHQKNEYIGIEELLLATTIYTEALYELSK